MTTGIFGGTFDPPHNGHLALLRAAKAELDLDRLVVLVVADPGHRNVVAPADARLALARAAFPGEEVELDDHARTVDLLRERRFDDPVFLVGADEFADFLGWKDPEGVLALARLGVATRPGTDQSELGAVLGTLSRSDRVRFFPIEPVDVSSTDVRRRVAAREPISDLVPEAVEREIERLGLFRTAEGGG